MKRIFALLLVLIMVVSLVACGNAKPDEDSSVATHLAYDFKENADKTPQEIADLLLTNPALQFMSATMPVEEGYLSGFDNVEIKGFDEGVMFGPAIGTIPFVGYVFDLSDGTDVDEFKQTLEDNANLRFNVCTEADEVVVESKGDKVIVIISPEKFEETPENAEDSIVIDGQDFVDEFDGESLD